MLMTAGITVSLGIQYKSIAVVGENYTKMLQWQNIALH